MAEFFFLLALCPSLWLVSVIDDASCSDLCINKISVTNYSKICLLLQVSVLSSLYNLPASLKQKQKTEGKESNDVGETKIDRPIPRQNRSVEERGPKTKPKLSKSILAGVSVQSSGNLSGSTFYLILASNWPASWHCRYSVVHDQFQFLVDWRISNGNILAQDHCFLRRLLKFCRLWCCFRCQCCIVSAVILTWMYNVVSLKQWSNITQMAGIGPYFSSSDSCHVTVCSML